MASELGVQTIQHTNGTDALTIDSSGRVLRSNIPSFRLTVPTAHQNVTTTSQVTVLWDAPDSSINTFNNGFTLSSGLLYPPVDGLYMFNTTVRADAIGTAGYFRVTIEKNGIATGNSEAYALDGDPPNDYTTLTVSLLIELTTSDYVLVGARASDDSNWDVRADSHFQGYLIG
jgi:hypothetical protein